MDKYLNFAKNSALNRKICVFFANFAAELIVNNTK